MALMLHLKNTGLFRKSIIKHIILCITAITSIPAHASSDGLCWRALGLNPGEQDVRLARTRPTLASNGEGGVWLSWQENEPRIFQWHDGRWSVMPVPSRTGTDTMRYPVVAAAPHGSIHAAVSANGDNGVSELHIGRWSGASWEWLGKPLLQSSAPFSHAQEVTIDFLDDTHPVIVWSEERHAKLMGLFAAQWDGTQWQYLQSLETEGNEHRLHPTVVVDSAKQPWVSWAGGPNSKLKVSRWDGQSWIDIGRQELESISEQTGRAQEPSLAIDSKGQVWLLWRASKQPGNISLVMAKWDGSIWTTVPTPKVQGGDDNTVGSARLTIRDDVPIIAWSQADETENHRLFAAKLTASHQWIRLLSGLHLDEGVSHVSEVRIAEGDSNSFFVSWDEPGDDNMRTRIVHAYICNPGEVPAPPPKSAIERETWPRTVDEAARQIVELLNDDSKAQIQSTPKEELIQYHFSLGMGIRNSMGLWRGNDDLLKSCGRGEYIHPDDCSMVIIEAVWDILQQADTQ